MHRIIKRTYWILQAQVGVDVRKLLHFLPGLLRYLWDYFRFRRIYRGQMEMVPCVHDRREEGGATKNEYFWQDLIVARMIHAAEPECHVDIGSRVDGFVAHVASFREIEVFDVRPISASIPGVVFRRADLMQIAESFDGYCDSLSCLHALEHFGLGRYGDPMNVQGVSLGLASMVRMIREGGVFYLSVPIGRERVEFNANWIFAPSTIISAAAEVGLRLKKLIVIDQSNVSDCDFCNVIELARLAQQRYSLGVFVFSKVAEEVSSK